jgi:hypothetical protein
MTRLRALFAGAILVGATAACAGNAPDVAAAPVTGVPMGTGGPRGLGLEMTRRTDGMEIMLPVPVAQVFPALEAVFASLQIPLTVRDPLKGLVGNEGLKFRRKLGALEARKLFDCGGSSGMPNSETYTIKMSVISTVIPTDDGRSRLLTVVQASGENPNYPGSGVSCASTGSLEDRIAADLRTRLNAAG